MKHYRFEVTATGTIADAEDLERVYRTDAGVVRVRIEGTSVVHVIDERAQSDPRDLPAFVELFFHDLFLLLNIAAPGSCGGMIRVSGGEFRVNEIRLDARVFQVGTCEPLPLGDVVAWYDTLQLGTEQLATSGIAKVLFHLLHLARGEESEWDSILRYGESLEMLAGDADADESLRRFFALRDAILRGRAPVLHPMHDDALDPRVDDATIELVEAADFAAGRVVTAIRELVRRPHSS